MRAKFINEKLTGFTEDSDAIKDMGIGLRGYLKPEDVVHQFLFDFKKEFNIHAYVDEAGSDYGIDSTLIYRIGDESFHDTHQPAALLLSGSKHELIFAMTKEAASTIKSNTNWGWFYYDGGNPRFLGDTFYLKDIYRQIFKWNNITPEKLAKSIKKYKDYIKTLNKFEKWTNES